MRKLKNKQKLLTFTHIALILTAPLLISGCNKESYITPNLLRLNDVIDNPPMHLNKRVRIVGYLIRTTDVDNGHQYVLISTEDERKLTEDYIHNFSLWLDLGSAAIMNPILDKCVNRYVQVEGTVTVLSYANAFALSSIDYVIGTEKAYQEICWATNRADDNES